MSINKYDNNIGPNWGITYNNSEPVYYKTRNDRPLGYEHLNEGSAWEDTEIWTFATEAERDAKYVELIANKVVIDKADRGQLIDDIAVWHNVFSETLIKIMLFLPYSDLGEKSRLKIVSDVIAKYNLDLVIKDFKPDYVIPERDKGVLATGLKEIEKYDAGIYQRLAMAVGLEADALHNEVIDAYERVIQTIHPTQQIDGNTLAGELPVNAGGTQT